MQIRAATAQPIPDSPPPQIARRDSDGSVEYTSLPPGIDPSLYPQILPSDYKYFYPTMTCPVIERGTASWYGGRHNGRRTASGEVYRGHLATAASNSLPMHTRVCVLDNATGRATTLKVNDTGGFARYNRVMDVSESVAKRLGMRSRGLTDVSIMAEECCSLLSTQGQFQYVSN